jgi:hypothetical protein
MRRHDRAASLARDEALEEALRRLGAEMLEEEVPERLRQVLRGKGCGAEAKDDSATGEVDQGRVLR